MKSRIAGLVPVFFIFLLFINGIPASASTGNAAELIVQGNALMQNRNYSGALAAYDLAISHDPNDINAWDGKVDALNRAGNFSGALAASDIAISLAPSRAQGWINRGYILYNLGRYEDEINAYNTAISLEPGNAEAWFNKGYALAGMKRYDEAIAAFDKVRELRPDYPKLDANRRIAEQLRDAAAPWYVRYAPALAAFVLVIALATGYFLHRHKTADDSDNKEADTRQRQRRKGRQQG